MWVNRLFLLLMFLSLVSISTGKRNQKQFKNVELSVKHKNVIKIKIDSLDREIEHLKKKSLLSIKLVENYIDTNKIIINQIKDNTLPLITVYPCDTTIIE